MPGGFVPWATIRREIHASMRREHGVRAKDVHLIEGLAGNIDGDPEGDDSLRLCERAFGGDAAVMKRFALHAWNDATGTFELARAPTGPE